MKRSVQAAAAGLETASYRMNILDVTRAAATQKCVVPTASTDQLERANYESDGWCPAVTDDLGDGASVTYRVGPEFAPDTAKPWELRRRVVSTGMVGADRRRVLSDLDARTAYPAVPQQHGRLLRRRPEHGQQLLRGRERRLERRHQPGQQLRDLRERHPGPGAHGQRVRRHHLLGQHHSSGVGGRVSARARRSLSQRQRPHLHHRSVHQSGEHVVERHRQEARGQLERERDTRGQQLLVLLPEPRQQRPAHHPAAAGELAGEDLH